MSIMRKADPREHAVTLSEPIEAKRPAEVHLRDELRAYAVKLRKLAYTLPGGVGENALLRLSEHMVETANERSR